MMRFAAFFCAAALLAGGPAPARAAGAGTVPAELKGWWVVPHRAYTPAKANPGVVKLLTDLGRTVEIKGDRLQSGDKDRKGYYLLAKFHPAARPQAVELRHPDHPKEPMPGIYKVERDVLTLAVGPPGKRPANFDNTKDQVILVLKRARR